MNGQVGTLSFSMDGSAKIRDTQKLKTSHSQWKASDLPYIDEAIVEMEANNGRGHPLVCFHSLLDPGLDNGEDLLARLVVEVFPQRLGFSSSNGWHRNHSHQTQTHHCNSTWSPHSSSLPTNISPTSIDHSVRCAFQWSSATSSRAATARDQLQIRTKSADDQTWDLAVSGYEVVRYIAFFSNRLAPLFPKKQSGD